MCWWRAGLIALLVADGTDPTVVECGGRTAASGTGCGIAGWVGHEDAVRAQAEGIGEAKRLGAAAAVVGGVLAFGALLASAAVVDVATGTAATLGIAGRTASAALAVVEPGPVTPCRSVARRATSGCSPSSRRGSPGRA
ncbi:MAG TPA: hypothetical protein VKZ81_10800 [Pseudonocardia sp.]|uniref:hypothetical protein n=1 Tax=Pseudonocardia sp. TaxID=60912 RepID=UPI002B4B2FB0|nr:hypothetical protein [Pseudonocardia sp.]HLU55938.1 hypothetical protein [Pseudonocardia sp.]